MEDLSRRYRFERPVAFDTLLETPLETRCVGAPADDHPRAFRLELELAPAAWGRAWSEGLFHLSPLVVPDGATLPAAAPADGPPVRLLVGLHPALLARLEPEEAGDKVVLEGVLGEGPSPFRSAFAWRALRVMWADEAGAPGDGVYVGWETAWAEEG